MTTQIYLGESCPLQQRRLTGLLEELSQVNVFEDGFSLYQQIHVAPPNLLIVNLFLPPLEPALMLRLLKFDSRFTTLPILCLTPTVEAGLADRLSRLGARATLASDCEPFILQEAVTTLLNLPLGPVDGPLEQAMVPHSMQDGLQVRQ